MSAAPAVPDPAIVYDGDCPVCTRFFRVYTRARANRCDYRLVDARRVPGLYGYLLREHNIDLDYDFVVYRDLVWYAGGIALGMLYFEGIESRAIRRLGMAALRGVYPILRVGRWLLLRALGRATFARDVNLPRR